MGDLESEGLGVYKSLILSNPSASSTASALGSVSSASVVQASTSVAHASASVIQASASAAPASLLRFL